MQISAQSDAYFVWSTVQNPKGSNFKIIWNCVKQEQLKRLNKYLPHFFCWLSIIVCRCDVGKW